MKKIVSIVGLLALMVSCQKKEQKTEEIKETPVMEQQTENQKSSQQFSETTLQQKMLSKEGKELTFGEIIEANKGRTTVIELWASWCPDCIKGIEKFQALQKDFPNVNYVMISFDKTQEKWKEAIEKYALAAQHYHIDQTMKGSFGQSVDLDWIPRYIVVDQEGNILLYKAITADAEELVATLKKA